MNPLGDFEKSNARQWDEESTFSEPSQSTTESPNMRTGQNGVAPSEPLNPKPYQTSNKKQNFGIRHSGTESSLPHGVKNTNPSAHRRFQFHQNNDPKGGNLNVNFSSRGHNQPQHGAGQDRRHTATGSHSSCPSPDAKAKTPWVKAQGLVTTRKGIITVEKERQKAEINKYLGTVESEADYPATAYYLWPKKGVNPRELLGWKLEKLDALRKFYRVLIEWDDKKHCLTINSERATSDHDMIATIKGIRQVIQSSDAEVVYASPQYIVTPPTAGVMRAIVQPKYDGNIMRVELSGQPFSTAEQEMWKSKRGEMLEENLTKFKEHLIKHTTLLAPLMGWMRMRVHFGHIRLGKVREEFVHSKYSLEAFSKMMCLSRVRTSGKFDRKLDDAMLAAKMRQKIVESPQYFCPVQARIPSLEDIKPKHMGIIFVNIPDGENLRIEADVDYTLEGGLGQYQIGTTQLFRDDRRNKRVEVTTLDIESKFDWTLEVITDGSINDLPSSLLSLIDGSLSGNSKQRVDRLGFTYPGVSPKCVHGLDVRVVVVRSVYRYMLRDSGYIVDIAVYREWSGYNTTGEPRMLSSVSMFHPVWDNEMDSIENTTRERNWDPKLRCFFEGENQSGGIHKFMEDVAFIQGLLSDAATVSNQPQTILPPSEEPEILSTVLDK